MELAGTVAGATGRPWKRSQLVLEERLTGGWRGNGEPWKQRMVCQEPPLGKSEAFWSQRRSSLAPLMLLLYFNN